MAMEHIAQGGVVRARVGKLVTVKAWRSWQSCDPNDVSARFDCIDRPFRREQIFRPYQARARADRPAPRPLPCILTKF
jgi:hypothetical protein